MADFEVKVINRICEIENHVKSLINHIDDMDDVTIGYDDTFHKVKRYSEIIKTDLSWLKNLVENHYDFTLRGQ